MTTLALATDLPSSAVTRPPTAEVVFCACAVAAPSASATQTAIRDSGKLMRFLMILPWGLWSSGCCSCTTARRRGPVAGRLSAGALPRRRRQRRGKPARASIRFHDGSDDSDSHAMRSEEHTSELQSLAY